MLRAVGPSTAPATASRKTLTANPRVLQPRTLLVAPVQLLRSQWSAQRAQQSLKSWVAQVAALDLGTSASASNDDDSEDSGIKFEAPEVIRKFFAALNNRDISTILMLVDENVVHQDLSHEAPATSHIGVARFYSDLVTSMAHNMQFVLEEVTEGDPLRVGVTWRMEVGGAEVPLGRGLSFYRLNRLGRIEYVRQSPEHFIKCAGLAQGVLGSASPFIGALGPAALPSFWSSMASAVPSMLPGPDAVMGGLMGAMGMGGSGSMGHPHMGGSGGAPTDLFSTLAGMAMQGMGGAPHMGSSMGMGMPPQYQQAPPSAYYSPAGGQPGSMPPHMAQYPPQQYPQGYAPPQQQHQAAPGGNPFPTPSHYHAAAIAAVPPGTVPMTYAPHHAAAAAAAGLTAGHSASPPAGMQTASPSPASSASPSAGPYRFTDRDVHGSPIPAREQGAEGGASPSLASGSASASASPAAATAHSPAASLPSNASPSNTPAGAAALFPAVSVGVAARSPAAGPGVIAANNVAPFPVRSSPHTAGHSGSGAAAVFSPAPGALSEASGDEEPSSGISQALPLAELAGLWVKDSAASQLDAYERMMDMWQLSGVQKATAKLIEGLEIGVQGSRVSVHFLTIIPMFKVTEHYDTARPTRNMRRDLRPGEAAATTSRTPQGIRIDASFGQPFPGAVTETYELRPAPAELGGGVELAVTSSIRLPDGRSESTCQVYRRQAGMTRSEFMRQSEGRNGRPNDILKKFGMPV